MEQGFKDVNGFKTPFGQGYVINANTPEERRHEINSFYLKSFIPTLLKLNEDLEEIDPNYTIVQLKIKFGGLSMYTSGVGAEGDRLINEASLAYWNASKITAVS